MDLEIFEGRRWVPLNRHQPPRILETETLHLRGGPPGAPCRLGWFEVDFDASGALSVTPGADERTVGHVGLIEIEVGGITRGEVEIVPSKLSEPAYQALRSDLQRVWGDLVLLPGSHARVSAGPPPAVELWERIASPVRAILDAPNEQLRVGTGVRRLDRIRKRRELRPSLVRAGMQGRAAVTQVLERSTDTPENRLLAATLLLLRNHARRDLGAAPLARELDRLRRHPVVSGLAGPLHRITWGMRSDPRYLQVLRVHQLLNRPELAPTEGPGELRLGIPGLPRLYEYWVYLQVLLAAEARYGPPLSDGYADLAVPLPGNRVRFDLPPGTTVTFPGPVHVAFEPAITTRGDGWKGLEYVPHPAPGRYQKLATPDVLVYRPGQRPWITVIDAKYVARHAVELHASRIHDKYARIRDHGVPAVRNVLAAHPHAGFTAQWAGYGHIAMCPGADVVGLWLPPTAQVPGQALIDRGPPTPPPEPQDPGDATSAGPRPAGASPGAQRGSTPTSAGPTPDGNPVPPAATSPQRGSHSSAGQVTVVADQYWMRDWVGDRRIELRLLAAAIAEPATVAEAVLVMPDIPELAGFAAAARTCGWHVEHLDSIERRSQLPQIRSIVERAAADGPVLVFTGDSALIGALPINPEVGVIRDLTDPPLRNH